MQVQRRRRARRDPQAHGAAPGHPECCQAPMVPALSLVTVYKSEPNVRGWAGQVWGELAADGRARAEPARRG